MPEYPTKGAYFGADHVADHVPKASTKGAYYYGVERLVADKKKVDEEKARSSASIEAPEGMSAPGTIITSKGVESIDAPIVHQEIIAELDGKEGTKEKLVFADIVVDPKDKGDMAKVDDAKPNEEQVESTKLLKARGTQVTVANGVFH